MGTDDITGWLTLAVNASGFAVLSYYFIKIAPVEREKHDATIKAMNDADIHERKTQREYDESRAERERKECEARYERLVTIGEVRVERVMDAITEQGALLTKAVDAIARMAVSAQRTSDSAIKTQAAVADSLRPHAADDVGLGNEPEHRR